MEPYVLYWREKQASGTGQPAAGYRPPVDARLSAPPAPRVKLDIAAMAIEKTLQGGAARRI